MTASYSITVTITENGALEFNVDSSLTGTPSELLHTLGVLLKRQIEDNINQQVRTCDDDAYELLHVVRDNTWQFDGIALNMKVSRYE